VATAELLVTGWGSPWFGAGLLDRAPSLRAIVHTAGSVRDLLSADLLRAGVTVSTAAAVNARPTAEYAVALIVLSAKHAWSHAHALASSGETRPQAGEAGLFRTTVGVVGASRVGRLVMRLLGGYEVRLLLADPYLDAATARRDYDATLVDLDTLCRESDIVTLHAPALPETRHLIDDRRLGLVRDGGVIVNTARGALIDTAALTRHCSSGRLDAALDVTDPEPLDRSHPLLALPNVFVSPHLAGSAGRELRRLGEFAVAEVGRYVAGQPLLGAITVADYGRIA
jgi:phosphoglycerate dehydrogenase-like enzyme